VDILKLEEEIEGTNYWDAYALDFRASFFGDECRLYIEVENGKSDQYCWEIVFYRCFKVNYETDAGWTCFESETGTRNFNMKDTPFKNLMSHTVHDIRLIVEKNNMIQATITLSSMLIDIVCQDIQVSKVLVSEQNFFWNV
jgi:lmo0381 protein